MIAKKGNLSMLLGKRVKISGEKILSGRQGIIYLMDSRVEGNLEIDAEAGTQVLKKGRTYTITTNHIETIDRLVFLNLNPRLCEFGRPAYNNFVDPESNGCQVIKITMDKDLELESVGYLVKCYIEDVK